MNRNYKLTEIMSIFNCFIFNFFGSVAFRELSHVRNFVRVSFHKDLNKTNIFAAQIHFFVFIYIL